jgi:hypothetical protein
MLSSAAHFSSASCIDNAISRLNAFSTCGLFNLMVAMPFVNSNRMEDMTTFYGIAKLPGYSLAFSIG